MLEGTLTTTDPKLQRLVTRLQRVQSRRERWDERGREDGEIWAIEVASQEELREAHEEWENYGEWEEDWDQADEGNLPVVPVSFDLGEALKKWLAEDAEEGQGSGLSIGDKLAYLAGWFDVVGHLWVAAALAVHLANCEARETTDSGASRSPLISAFGEECPGAMTWALKDGAVGDVWFPSDSVAATSGGASGGW